MSTTIPVQAARVPQLSYFSPSTIELLSVIGISGLEDAGGEPITRFPVCGIIQALDLAEYNAKATGDQRARSDAAMILAAVFHGSVPQFAAGDWNHPEDMYRAMRTAGSPEEATQARLALEAFIGLATLIYAVKLGDGELPDDDEGTVARMTQTLQTAGWCNRSGEVDVDRLLYAEHLRQQQIASTETTLLPDAR